MAVTLIAHLAKFAFAIMLYFSNDVRHEGVAMAAIDPLTAGGVFSQRR